MTHRKRLDEKDVDASGATRDVGVTRLYAGRSGASWYRGQERASVGKASMSETKGGSSAVLTSAATIGPCPSLRPGDC